MLGTELCQTDDKLNIYAAQLEKKDSREVGESKREAEGRRKAAGSGFTECGTDPLKPVGNGFEGVLFRRQKASAYFGGSVIIVKVLLLSIVIYY